ncbi:MAG: ComF family protein [Candidatus Omnitrophica bacterium]|nr:ComF family protein [Candidatus Omnitrophota bacterium]
MIDIMLDRWFNGLLELIWPKVCIVCRKNLKNIASIDNIICKECWGKIKRNLPPFCYSCGRHLESKDLSQHHCVDCRKRKFHFDRAFSPCVYEGVLKKLIHAFKYEGKDYLGKILSTLMIDFIREYNLPIEEMDYLIPLPLHKTRLREREFNQAEILSRYLAKEFNKPILNNVLLRHRLSPSQTELDINKRWLNVQGSFSIDKTNYNYYIENKNILLIDDVLTTGATSSAAAATLKAAGAKIVFVLTLAN